MTKINFRDWLKEVIKTDPFSLVIFLLSMGAGFFLLQVEVLSRFGSGWTEKAEWFLFVSSAVGIPVFYSVFFALSRRKSPENLSATVTLLAFINSGVAPFVALTGDTTQFRIELILIFNLLIFAFGIEAKKWIGYARKHLPWFALACWASALIAPFMVRYNFDLKKIVVGVFVASLVWFCGICLGKLETRSRSVQYLFSILVVVAIVSFVFLPDLPFDRFHYGYYLGPVSAVTSGKTILVDTFSQYGVLVFYFISGIFKFFKIAPGFEGLAFFVCVSTIGLYIFQYFLLTKMKVNPFLAAIGIGFLVTIHNFSTIGFITFYPSTGALRFGVPFLLFVPWFWGDGTSKFSYLFRTSVLAVSSLWSVETFVYTLVTYVAIDSFFALVSWTEGGKGIVRTFFRRLVGAVLVIGMFHGTFAIFAFVRSGVLPSWRTYIDYVLLYTPAEGLGLMRMPIFSLWNLVIAVYLVTAAVTVLHVLAGEAKESIKEYGISLALSVLGVAFITYYIGRSHDNNLLHCGTPAILLLVFWASRIPDAKKVFRSTVWILLLSMIIINPMPRYRDKLPSTLFGKMYNEGIFALNALRCAFSFCTDFDFVPPIISFLENDDNQTKRVSYMIGGNAVIDTVFATNRPELLPIGYFSQEENLSDWKEKSKDYESLYKVGDLIFFDSKFRKMIPSEKKFYSNLLRKVCMKFECVDLAKLDAGVTVMQLETKQVM